MDFQDLLNHADYNISESKHSGNTAVRYSSVLPPPKKVPKPNVQSENIRKFLEKKKMEEAAKVAEAQKQKEKLLALRAQNSKNNKKAKIMASRTKDNDFSRIKLTDDEVEAKKKREAELIRKNLADKVERMKARIEMEEKEKLMPRKRKRKSKNAQAVESVDDSHNELQNEHKDLNNDIRSSDAKIPLKNNVHKPKPPPPPPAVSFTDLLKLAEKKQFEPLALPPPKKEEEKLMTKKERKLREEELARLKRKQERLAQGESGRLPKPNPAQALPVNKKNTSEKVDSKKPLVIHVSKDTSKPEQDSAKFKIPKGTVHAPSNKNIPVKHKDTNSHSVLSEKSIKSPIVNGQKKINKLRDNSSFLRETEIKQKVVAQKKNGLKVNPVQAASKSAPQLDTEALKAKLEKEIREKIEKELEEKMAAKFAQFQNQANKANEVSEKVKKEPVVGNNVVKKPVVKPTMNSRQDQERLIAMKKQAMLQKRMKPSLPEKKPFHKNPYLDPPRRLLEPQRPRPLMKRRIESDDDDDDDDDDMRDFIDDSPSQNEENYSEYIREIFKYDKSKYIDDDDDEVMESSFAEQMKEEVRSAKLGYLEDLEEEKKEMERKKRKKVKK